MSYGKLMYILLALLMFSSVSLYTCCTVNGKQSSNGLLLTISTDKDTYEIGEIINVTIKTEKTLDSLVNLTMRNSCYALFFVYPESDNSTYIYSSNYGVPCLQVITPLIWQPYEIKYWNYTWDQSNNTASFNITNGDYILQGAMNTLYNLTYTNNHTITLEDKSSIPGFESFIVITGIVFISFVFYIQNRYKNKKNK